MSQNGDTIDVDKPVVRYALGEGSASNPDDDVLDVQAQLGKITDNQRFLTLWMMSSSLAMMTSSPVRA